MNVRMDYALAITMKPEEVRFLWHMTKAYRHSAKLRPLVDRIQALYETLPPEGTEPPRKE